MHYIFATRDLGQVAADIGLVGWNAVTAGPGRVDLLLERLFSEPAPQIGQTAQLLR